MSSGRFLERWSRLKKAAEKASTVEITDAESLLANLTPDSDFGQFLRQEVSEEIRRQALKTLFADPQFNVMDGLDIYIDDYSISEPIPPEMLASLNQAKILFETPDVEDAPEQTASEFREASPGDEPEIVAARPADLPSENNQ
ncbi:MAG: DUF3306 domain-containing protein [Azonexus sp.]